MGNPLHTLDSVVKTAMWNQTIWAWKKKNIQKLYKNRYPKLVIATGDFEVIEKHTAIKNRPEKLTRIIIKINHDSTEDGVWTALLKVKGKISAVDRVAIHHIQRMENIRLRKIVEEIFHKSDTKVGIYANILTENIHNEIKKNKAKRYENVYPHSRRKGKKI